jgi:hypothetical protein
VRSSKVSIRLSTFAIIGVLLVGSAAGAATYSMTGKAATGSGAFVDLPAKGNAPCPSIVGKIGFGSGMYPQPKTATSMMLIGPVPHNPGGCIPGGAAKVATTAMGGFTMPIGFFNQPFPGGTMGGGASKLNVSAVPNVTQILQLATSFKFEGPLASPFSMLNPVNMTAMYAPWRKFGHTAWVAQTGRVGKNFTACAASVPANVPCTFPSSGLIPAIIKNIGGPGGGFGGTMGLVLTTSPTQASSLAVKAGAGMTVAFVFVGGMGSRAAGRGYAAYDTDFLPGGPVFLNYKLTTMKTMVSQRVIASVMTYIAMGMTGTNMNWGFPWTTGQIIVRGTGGNGMGGAVNATVTAMGFDTVTGMGNRNIQLVAGGVAQSNIQGPNGTPNYTVMRLPEPGAALQLAAGAAALLVIALWRGRKAR